MSMQGRGLTLPAYATSSLRRGRQVYPAPEVRQRSVPPAKAGRMADRTFDVLAGGPDRVHLRHPTRQVGGDRGRERAAGAVRVLGWNARSPEFGRLMLAAGDVDALGPGQVPAFDEYDARTEPDDSSAGLAHGLD